MTTPGNTKGKGVWWLSPSLLEPVDGPWGRIREDFGGDIIAAWSAILDWARSLHLSHIVTSVEPFMSDRTVVQWPFHYICHFPQDPAARCFDPWAIDQNIHTVRQIALLAREKDIKLMLHHYNFMAPEKWVDEHPELARKLDDVEDPMWGRRFHADRLGFLVAHVCWNDPTYRSFMIRCWRELFQNIPELSGLLLTAGEFSYCRCEICTGGEKSSIFDDSDEAREDDPALRTRLTFIEEAVGVLNSLNKDIIIRGWGMEKWKQFLPSDLTYATKFSVFDACRGGPDPKALEWSQSRRKTWMMQAIESENTGPLIWHDADWANDFAERLNAADSVGTLVHLNVHWGHSGHLSTFTSSRNSQRLLESLEPKASPGNSAHEFRLFFGLACGDIVFKAAKLIAAVPLEINGIIHLQGEGFTFHMQPWFDGNWRWPGVLGDKRFDPPPWANTKSSITLTELMAQASADPACLLRLMDEPGTVISHCLELAGFVQPAIELLADCKPDNPRAQAEVKVLLASAHIATLFCRETVAVLRARLAWHLVRILPPTNSAHGPARHLAALHYDKAVSLLRSQLHWTREIASYFPDYLVHVGTARDTFFRLPMATRLKIREAELKLIKEALLPITDDLITISHTDF